MRSLKPFSIGRQEVAGNGAAHDRVDPDEVVLRIVMVGLHRGEAGLDRPFLDVHVLGQGEHADVDLAELAAPAGLLLVTIAALGVDLDGFAVGDLGLVGVDLDLVAALEPLAEDLQVQLAHAGGHHFLGLRVAVDAEGGVLLADLVQRAGELGLVAAALGA